MTARGGCPPAVAVLAAAVVTGLVLWSWQTTIAAVLLVVLADVVDAWRSGR